MAKAKRRRTPRSILRFGEFLWSVSEVVRSVPGTLGRCFRFIANVGFSKTRQEVRSLSLPGRLEWRAGPARQFEAFAVCQAMGRYSCGVQNHSHRTDAHRRAARRRAAGCFRLCAAIDQSDSLPPGPARQMLPPAWAVLSPHQHGYLCVVEKEKNRIVPSLSIRRYTQQGLHHQTTWESLSGRPVLHLNNFVCDTQLV